MVLCRENMLKETRKCGFLNMNAQCRALNQKGNK